MILRLAFIVFFLSVMEVKPQSETPQNLTDISYYLKKAADQKDGHYDSLEFYLNQAAALNRSLKSDSLTVEIHKTRAFYFFQEANYEKSFEWYLKAYEICEKKNMPTSAVICLNQMAKIFLRQNNPDKAIEYLLKAIDRSKKNNLTNKLAELYNNIGFAYVKSKNFTEGEKFHLEALLIRKQTHDSEGIARSYSNLAFVAFNKNNLEKSKDYFYMARDIYKHMNDPKMLARATADCADIELHMKNYNTALDFLKEAMDIERRFSDRELRLTLYKKISKVYEGLNKYKDAFLYQSKYFELKDSIFSVESLATIQKMESKHQLESKQQEIALLKKDNDLQSLQNSKNKAIILSLAGGFLIVIISLFVTFKQFREKKKANNILEEKNRIIQQKQNEIIDSIQYAKRIQKALISSEKYLERSLARLNPSKNKSDN